MPNCWAYPASGKEYFHPASGMVPGDFMVNNSGMAILRKIKNFYETVFNTTLSGEANTRANMDKYGYSLYGSRTVTTDHFNGTYHLGVDMTYGLGKPVYSAHAGELLWASENRIAIYDQVKKVTYLYLHTQINDAIKNKGTESDSGITVFIEVGQLLGTQSNQGLWGSGNDHLHFEVKNGRSWIAEMPTNSLNTPLPNLYPYNYM